MNITKSLLWSNEYFQTFSELQIFNIHLFLRIHRYELLVKIIFLVISELHILLSGYTPTSVQLHWQNTVNHFFQFLHFTDKWRLWCNAITKFSIHQGILNTWLIRVVSMASTHRQMCTYDFIRIRNHTFVSSGNDFGYGIIRLFHLFMGSIGGPSHMVRHVYTGKCTLVTSIYGQPSTSPSFLDQPQDFCHC